jgi:hypothetical protein
MRERMCVQRKYEDDFARLGKGWLAIRKLAERQYGEVVDARAREGWPLAQIVSPGTGLFEAPNYYELIFE